MTIWVLAHLEFVGPEFDSKAIFWSTLFIFSAFKGSWVLLSYLHLLFDPRGWSLICSDTVVEECWFTFQSLEYINRRDWPSITVTLWGGGGGFFEFSPFIFCLRGYPSFLAQYYQQDINFMKSNPESHLWRTMCSVCLHFHLTFCFVIADLFVQRLLSNNGELHFQRDTARRILCVVSDTKALLFIENLW